MKYRKVILFLTTSLIALSGCKNPEPIKQPVTTETVETIEDKNNVTEITKTTSEITTETATVPETSAESTTANLSQLSLTSNVTITSWGTNKFTGNKQALECSYSDEWAEAVMDVINTLQNGYMETLSEEKLDELIREIALTSANVYGEDADEEEVTKTIQEVLKVFKHLNEKAQQQNNIDKIDYDTGNNGGEQQSQSDNQQNNPPADQESVGHGPAPDGAGSGIPFGSSAPPNDQKGEFNVVPGLNIH